MDAATKETPYPPCKVPRHTTQRSPKTIVIVGAGIVGACTAYHLSEQLKKGDQAHAGARITVLERHKIAGCASGKAGGFLARGWGDDSPTEQLHHVSFDMHEALAKTLKLNSYRKIPTLQVSEKHRVVDNSGSPAPLCPWLDGTAFAASHMDTTTAQVTPSEFTTKIMAAAVANGNVEVINGRVTAVRSRPCDGPSTVATTSQDEAPSGDSDPTTELGADGFNIWVAGKEDPIAADSVVIAMGPWSVEAALWFPQLRVPMEGIYSSSIIFHDRPLEATALFCGDNKLGCHLEVYPRPGNEVYVCGLGGSRHIQASRLLGPTALAPEAVKEDPARVRAAEETFRGMTIDGGNAKSDVQQACMRPCTADGLPIIGAIPGTTNAYIATGHNCWGILWGPVTGLAVSELVLNQGKSTSVRLDAFDPARFSAKSVQ